MMFWKPAFLVITFASCLHGLLIGGRDELQNDYRPEQIIANHLEDYNQRIYNNPQWRPYKSSAYRQDLINKRPLRAPVGKDYESSLCCRLRLSCCYKDAFQKDSRQEQMYQDLLMKFNEPGPPLGDSTMKSNEPAPPLGDSTIKAYEQAPPHGDPKMKSNEPGPPLGDSTIKAYEQAPPRGDPKMKSNEPGPPLGDSMMKENFLKLEKTFNDMFGNLEDSYKPQYQRKPMLDNELFGRGRGDQLDNELFGGRRVGGGFDDGNQYGQLHSDQYNRNIPRKLYNDHLYAEDTY